MNTAYQNDREKLLYEISIYDFCIVDLTEYLDTHPDNQAALKYLAQYVYLKNKSTKEYSNKYGPLTVTDYDYSKSAYFKWIKEPWPWQGGF